MVLKKNDFGLNLLSTSNQQNLISINKKVLSRLVLFILSTINLIMKNQILLLFLVCNSIMFAQNTEFIYEYKFVPDSTDRNSVVKEMMVLSIFKNKSQYYSLDRYLSDSLVLDQEKRNLPIDFPEKKMIRDRVLKDLDKKQTTFVTHVASTEYKVDQQIDLNWTLQPEFSEVLNYKVQKAITNFGGRKWTAWFSTELPIQDGPFKFQGLPGLILKLEDSSLSHQFELFAIKKRDKEFVHLLFGYYRQHLNINFDEYKKVLLKDRRNPGTDLYGTVPDQTDSEGNFRTGDMVIRDQIKFFKEAIAKDNNLIEIDLLR